MILRFLKIILIVAVILVITISIILLLLSMQPFVPNNYTQIVKTGGELEAKYLAMGASQVEHMEVSTEEEWGNINVYYHFCRAALFHEARPFTVNLCLTKDKTEANGNALFRVATLTEAQEYLTAAVEQGELLLDLTRKDTVAQGIVYYQSVQQYRNQINHATDSAVKFQKDTGLLPLSTSAIEQTLGDVAFYLFKLKECKATAPVGIELLDSNKAF